MSSRIRIFATHPQYGVFVGPTAKHQIAASAGMFWQADHHRDKSISHRTKRIGEQLGWTVKLFRVPKGVKLAKTEWGRFLAQQGLFPYKEREGQLKAHPEVRGRLAVGEPPPEVLYNPNPPREGANQVFFVPAGNANYAQNINWVLYHADPPWIVPEGLVQAPPPQNVRPHELREPEPGWWEPVEPMEPRI
jgi:hypothetical protein